LIHLRWACFIQATLTLIFYAKAISLDFGGFAMTSKERLLCCIRHEPVDHVPISTYELVGWNADSWENNDPSYHALMDVIREKTDCIYMLTPDLISPFDPLMEKNQWREGASSFERTVYHTPMGDLESLHREDDGIHTRWTIKHMLEEIGDIDKYLSMPYIPPKPDMAPFFREQEALGDKGIMMITVSDPICVAAELFEMGRFLTFALEEPARIQYLLDALHERQIQELAGILKHNVKDVLFRICGPEYATPPYLPPRLFPQLVTRYLITIIKNIREAGGLVRIHSHGKIGRVLDQFALTDAQGLDPIEPPPDGDIELADVKRIVGDKFCLFGNIELKELENVGRDRIDAIVHSVMDAAKHGGGFVLMPTAAPINSPLSKQTEGNYLQMIDSALKYGKY
jgi:hypothetical protein